MTGHAPQPQPTAVMRDAERRVWLRFATPRRTVVAYAVAEVLPALREVEDAVATGLAAAGWVSYEAAPAFDPALRVRSDDGRFPLLWFGLFDAPEEIATLPPAPQPSALPATWTPSLDAPAYAAALANVKHAIREGETYQVNYTLRLRAEAPSCPWDAFRQLVEAQPTGFSAFVDAGDWTLCSASPELFLARVDDTVESRPMKGTASRGPDTDADLLRRAALLASDKERAEHLMIVDMVRNDLGRVAFPGSVEVPALLVAERYPTVWQLTSTVRARTQATLSAIFAATFPPASITGAPKARTMELISELETTPRRVYTGTLGFALPGGRFQFNVAIRTLACDRRNGTAEYGVGGGIVWDSETDAEWRECAWKARILSHRPPEFELLETLLWTPQAGHVLLDRHLRRLARAAEYFGRPFDASTVREALRERVAALPAVPHRVRLTLSRSGAANVTATPLDPAHRGFADPVLDTEAVDPDDPFLRHKTTHRAVYAAALARHPGASDVLLRNTRGEVTESTLANLVYELDGTFWTPPVESGLLPGTYRDWLVESGRVRERPLRLDELDRVTTFHLANSVRGLHRVRLVRP